MPAVPGRWDLAARHRRGRAGFYVGCHGRSDGVFYAWRHVRRSIDGLPEGHVKGFETLEEANEYAAAQCN